MTKQFSKQEKNILTQICTTWIHNVEFLREVIARATDALITTHEEFQRTHSKRDSIDDSLFD
jgi:hypothetical protein